LVTITTPPDAEVPPEAVVLAGVVVVELLPAVPTP